MASRLISFSWHLRCLEALGFVLPLSQLWQASGVGARWPGEASSGLPSLAYTGYMTTLNLPAEGRRLVKRLKKAPPEEADKIKRNVAGLLGAEVFYVCESRFEQAEDRFEKLEEVEEAAEDVFEPVEEVGGG